MNQVEEAALNAVVEQAAERGAAKALERLGLHEEHAGRDIRDLRDLIDAWRVVRGSALRSIGKIIVMALLGLIALAVYHRWPWGE